MKPRIGVTCSNEGMTTSWCAFWIAIRLAGGVPIRIRPKDEWKSLKLDGLILNSGADISPKRYGKKYVPTQKNLTRMQKLKQAVACLWHPTYIRKLAESTHIEPERDAMEHHLLECAVQNKTPVLGVCRGSQFLNVFFGGTLHQPKKQPLISMLPKKSVQFTEKGKIREIFKKQRHKVNGMHKQAVHTCGKNIIATSHDTDGNIESLEHTTHNMIGIQWHPEYLPYQKEQRKLVQSFIEASRKGATKRKHLNTQ